jgi:hypothetical protein
MSHSRAQCVCTVKKGWKNPLKRRGVRIDPKLVQPLLNPFFILSHARHRVGGCHKSWNEGVLQCPSAWNDSGLTVILRNTNPIRRSRREPRFSRCNVAAAGLSLTALSRRRGYVPSAIASRGKDLPALAAFWRTPSVSRLQSLQRACKNCFVVQHADGRNSSALGVFVWAPRPANQDSRLQCALKLFCFPRI